MDSTGAVGGHGGPRSGPAWVPGSEILAVPREQLVPSVTSFVHVATRFGFVAVMLRLPRLCHAQCSCHTPCHIRDISSSKWPRDPLRC